MELTKEQILEDIKILEENNIHVDYQTDEYSGKPCDFELQSYTDAGGDMYINLDELSKRDLLNYIDGFDINEEVCGWWDLDENGCRGAGLPFSNVKEHYNDVEDWTMFVKRVANLMPY